MLTNTKPKAVHLCDLKVGMVIEGRSSDTKYGVLAVEEFFGRKPMLISVRTGNRTTFIEGRRRDVMWLVGFDTDIEGRRD